jgi:CHAD domain-containing protein
MTTEVRETEQKYEAEGDVALPSLADLPQVAAVSEPEQETLTAEYYDTDDLRLLKAGITLRRREGGSDEGWHLKLPDAAAGTAEKTAGASRRREIRLTLDQGDRDRLDRRRKSGGDPVPAELAGLVRAHARDASLRPVARIETRRRLTTLLDAAGTSLAEIAVDEVAAQSLGASTTLSRWNEVEIELTGGRPRLLRAAAERLRRSGLRPAGRSAKLERALAADAPPSVASASPGGRHDGAARADGRPQAGDVVSAYVRDQAGRLKALDAAVRRDEPDGVHQMRVTTRRLRAALQAFPMVLPESATTGLRDELRWLGRVLGEARDAEVLERHFEAALAELPVELVIGPAKARVTMHFAPEQAATRKAVLKALDSRRYFRLLDELDRLVEDPPQTPAATAAADEILPQAVARAYRRTKRRMNRARQAPAGAVRDTALHEARKAAKRARYAADAAEPAVGKKARRFAKRMKAVQSVLGDHQDAVTARAVAREIGMQAHLAGENAFSFGLLNERAHRQAVECQRQARSVWKRAARRKTRRWLAGSR